MGSGLGCVQGWGPEGGLGGLPTHQVVLCVGGIHSTLLLFWVLRSGSWVFAFFCISYVQVYTESYSETFNKLKFCVDFVSLREGY